MTTQIQPRTLFIIDAAGAALSAFMLGVVLMRSQRIFGMPKDTLTILAALPVGFVLYDAYCLFTKQTHRARLLLVIGLLNLSYCFVSVGYFFRHATELTTFGWLYFGAEVLIVLGLATLEIRTARSNG